MGHIALGYIISSASARSLKQRINIPLVLTLSVIPDLDIFFERFHILEHRGPTHSVIVALLIFAPFFVAYHWRTTPYFLAYTQHFLPSDYIVGSKVQLFWPLTTQNYGIGVSITSSANIALEWTLFLAAMAMMLRTRDIRVFFKPHTSNLILLIPIFTVILPTFASFPLFVPIWLVPPHLFYLTMFLASISILLLKSPIRSSGCWDEDDQVAPILVRFIEDVEQKAWAGSYVSFDRKGVT